MRSLTGSRAETVAPLAVASRLLSDARLVRLASTGSEAAFAAIFERYHQALYRYCHSILGNGHDAADALQNTMLSALRALPGETRQIALRAWLYRIAHNESISLLRTRRADSDLQSAAHVGDLAAEGIVESRERLRALIADLQHLTEQQRGALLLRELGELEFSEIACTLQISAAAAKQSVYEARCALQAMEQGRAMDCDAVRRALSDGDRRVLRAKQMRGHLRACAGCQDFHAALRQRPADLAALVPPPPLAMTAAMLHGVLDCAGHGGGSGLLTGLAASVKAGGAFSLAPAKVATIALVAGSVTGGAAYVDPGGRAVRPSTPDAAAHDGHSTAGVLAAARDRRDMFSLPSKEGRRMRSTTAASMTTAAPPAGATHGVTAQQRAGSAPSPATADTAKPSPAKAGHEAAREKAATGERLESPATRTSEAAELAGKSVPRAGKSASRAAKPASSPGKPGHPAGKSNPAGKAAPPTGKAKRPAGKLALPAAKPAPPAGEPAQPAGKPAAKTSPAPVIPTASADHDAPGKQGRGGGR